MRRTARVWFATTALLVGLVAPAHAVTAAGHGALPYLRASDSPFAGGPPFGGTFSYFHLEDFEDGALNTPGVSANAGSVISGNGFVDSVDADDGTVDGSGLGGKSWYSTGSATLFVFTFNEVALGGLPNYAGVVWTDVGVNSGPTTGVGPVEFRAYDKDGVLQITIGAAALGDGNVTGQTAEDRFFGAFIASAFISRIEIEMPTSGDWEVDHLQYGRATTPSVPIPASAAMMVAAILGLAAVIAGLIVATPTHVTRRIIGTATAAHVPRTIIGTATAAHVPRTVIGTAAAPVARTVVATATAPVPRTIIGAATAIVATTITAAATTTFAAATAT